MVIFFRCRYLGEIGNFTIVKQKNTKHLSQLKKIGNKLRELRKEAGYSSYDYFAWENKIARTTYQNMEEGKNCTLVSLMKVLDAHGMSLQEFFNSL